MITEEIGKRIKEIRSEKGISQEKLALKAELDRTYVAGVENGKRNPSRYVMLTISHINDRMGG